MLSRMIGLIKTPKDLKELLTAVKSYNPNTDENLIRRAYVYGKRVHGSQKRASGELYFTHPVAVAHIVAEMKLDDATIVTALLHDTVEDTTAEYEDIVDNFGTEVASLVDGVTKLTRIQLQSAADKQAENFRKLVLAMSEDIRVLLVKLSDRVHNMRTLHHITKPEKRHRIALETIEIYAPLAERIGMQRLKDELQQRSFKELHPDEYESIHTRLSFLREDGQKMVKQITKELGRMLADHDIEARISGREKAPYSIWRKMQRKNVAFEQLSDIMAFRVITDDLGACYQVLGLIHNRYSVVPGRFKDFISTPKQNGYSSLHTTVIGPYNQRIEIQIRTEDMHRIAEMGVAAHWAYKQGRKSAPEPSGQGEGKQYKWLRELLDILENAQKPGEFLENTKLELFQEQVFCFTPRGELFELPRGATPVDFAYAVHSAVGDTCVGSKVNGRLTPLSTVLKNGDQIEILTSKNQTPSAAWERFVVTGKARSRIRRYIRQQQRGEYAELGKAMLEKVFRQEGYDFTEKAIKQVASQFDGTEAEDVYVAIGSGHRQARDVFYAIFPGHKAKTTGGGGHLTEADVNRNAKQRAQSQSGKKKQPSKDKKDKPVAIKGLIPGMAVHYARCCHPLPGDRIVGIVTTGKGVTIHTIDCETLESFADQPERWLDVSWGDEQDTEQAMIGRLKMVVANETSSLGTLSLVIGKNEGNITNLKITNRSLDFYELFIDVQVHDVRHLNNIMAALRASPIITDVVRARMV